MSVKAILKAMVSARGLFFVAVLVLAIPNVALCFTERLSVAACLANVLLPVGVVWLLMSLHRSPGKMVWILFPLVFLAAFQLVLLYLFGNSVIAVDMFLNLVTTNPGEAGELLGNLLPAVFGVVVVYVPVLALALVSIHRHHRLCRAFMLAQRRVATAVIALGAASLGVSYATDADYRAELDLYPVNVFYNMCLAVERTVATSAYASTSAGFTFRASATHAAEPREVYVMVIGETARACNFGLYGYGRDTTPLLSHTDGLVAFTKAVTQSNTTHKSVPMLLSAVSAENFDSVYYEKGIITAFKEAGYHTTFISNQKPNHSFIDFFGEEANDCLFLKDEVGGGADTPDAALLPEVRQVLAKGHRKQLIVLHTYGSHFNYRERYPRGEAHFVPDDATEAKAENREQLVNAYDNTIRVTDALLHGIVAQLSATGAQAAMVYTSDHGENIFDDSRRLFLHASPVPSYYELHVPMLVWTSAAYRHAHPRQAAHLVAHHAKPVATSLSVFHTLLDLAGVITPLRDDALSVASASYAPRPFLYLDDHNRAVPLGKMLRSEKDFELFRKEGMRLAR